MYKCRNTKYSPNTNFVWFSFSGSHRNNECGTKIHGNDSEKIFCYENYCYSCYILTGYMYVCMRTFPTPFSLFIAIQKYSFYTFNMCVSECMYVWAATKFQGQSYKIIVWRHIKAKMHGVRQILLSPLYKYCNPDNMFH